MGSACDIFSINLNLKDTTCELLRHFLESREQIDLRQVENHQEAVQPYQRRRLDRHRRDIAVLDSVAMASTASEAKRLLRHAKQIQIHAWLDGESANE